MINQATPGQTILLGTDGVLHVKGTWDASPTPAGWLGGGATAQPDVDLSAVLLAQDGTAMEAIFFNHTKSVDQSIHLVSGDQTSGNVGEEIQVRLHSVASHVHCIAFAISSANAVPLSIVKSLCISATLAEQTSSFHCDHLTWQQQGAVVRGNVIPDHTVLLPMFLKRSGIKSSDNWVLHVAQSNSISQARTFVEALPEIRSACELPSGGATKFKIPVVLTKDEQLSVTPGVHGPLHIGCGWEMDSGTEGVDADLSAMLIKEDGTTLVEAIFWGKLTAFDGNIVHSGDNLTGEGEGDDESIVVNLASLPKEVHSIVFLVSNYSEGNLKRMHQTHFRIVRLLDNAELVRYDGIGAGGNYSGFIPCSLSRAGNGKWTLTCHAVPCGGKTVHDEEVRNTVQQLLVPGRKAPTVKPVNLRQSLLKQAADLPRATASTASGGKSAAAGATRGSGTVTASSPDSTFRAKIIIFIAVIIAAYFFFGFGSGKKNQAAGRGGRRY